MDYEWVGAGSAGIVKAMKPKPIGMKILQLYSGGMDLSLIHI